MSTCHYTQSWCVFCLVNWHLPCFLCGSNTESLFTGAILAVFDLMADHSTAETLNFIPSEQSRMILKVSIMETASTTSISHVLPSALHRSIVEHKSCKILNNVEFSIYE